MLTLKQIEDRCLYMNGHKACRYLAQDDTHMSRYLCVKLVPSMKATIDHEVSEMAKNAKKNGQDMTAMGRPIGDNCPGYLYLKHKKQGYDIVKP